MELTNEIIMPGQDYQNTCNAIRAKTGEQDLIKSGDLVEQVEKVYEKGLQEGQKNGYDIFWDIVQQNGNRQNYENAFAGLGWTEELFKPKYNIQPNNSYMMFRRSLIKNLRGLSVLLDFSKSTNMEYMFALARVEQLGEFNVTSCINLRSTFSYTYNLHTIEKFVLREDGTNKFTETFAYASALQNITIEGIIGNSLDLSHCTKLTLESIKSIVNALSNTVEEKTAAFSQAAIKNAYGSVESAEWLELVAGKLNWTISLV